MIKQLRLAVNISDNQTVLSLAARKETVHVQDQQEDSLGVDLADYDAAQKDQNCWLHFDFGMLDEWNKTVTSFCDPQTVSESTAGWLRCRVQVDDHLPPATAPHTMCDGTNILLDLAKMSPTNCLASRPGYMCDETPIWYSYTQGALSANCTRTPAFTPDKFPGDHLRDMFASFQGAADAPDPAAPFVAGTDGAVDAAAPITLLVARERGEHANLFHASTDFLNILFTLHVTGAIDAARRDNRRGMDSVQLLLLDEQRGPFEDAFLAPIFSPRHPILRPSSLLAAGVRRLRLPRALFVPPGYSSVLYAKGEPLERFRTADSHGYCTSGGSRLIRAYRAFGLGGLGIRPPDDGAPPPAAAAAVREGAPLRVTLLSRRPYTCDGVEHSFMSRQFANEDELLAALRAEPGVNVTRRDFACRPLREQVEAMASTDVLVAMHGAAMMHSVFLPDGAAVVELFPKSTTWRVFEHLVRLRGLPHWAWVNPDEANIRRDDSGEFITVPVPAVADAFRAAVQAVRAARGGAGPAAAPAATTPPPARRAARR
jgi:EGF domain-specific O-GlcNAc transferase